MPRTVRASRANYCHHVLNGGNVRSRVFHQEADYSAFIELIQEAGRRRPMRVLAYCLMPKHFHLVPWAIGDGDLSTWMAWLMNAQVRRHHRHYHSSGHIWRGRFKAFPMEQDDHLRVVLHYVERNRLRAGMVERAEDWPWSSLRPASSADHGWLAPGPAPRGRGWDEEVNAIGDDGVIVRPRPSVDRGSPFGSEVWTRRTAEVLRPGSTIRGRGRPRKASAGP